MRAIPAVCATEVMGDRDPGSPDHIRRRADRKRFAWAYSQMDDKIAGSVLPHVPSMFLPDVHESVSEYASRVMDYDRDALHEDMVRMDMLDETTGVQEARVLVAKTSAFVQLAEQLDTLQRSIQEAAGVPFNVDSPKQLGEILFDEMGIEGGKKGKTGAYATGADVLEDLATEHDLH